MPQRQSAKTPARWRSIRHDHDATEQERCRSSNVKSFEETQLQAGQ